MAAPSAAAASIQSSGGQEPQLRFKRDGTVKIVQFNDTQDDETTDERTIELIAKVVQTERPDLVVFVGDNINGDPDTRTQARQALNNVIAPVEAAGVAWAAQVGTRRGLDSETGWDEGDTLAISSATRTT